MSKPDVSARDVRALATFASSDSENHTGGVLGYVSCKAKQYNHVMYAWLLFLQFRRRIKILASTEILF